jgi:DNA polymerase III alpha subunit
MFSFIPLHLHSEYSFHAGVPTVPELIRRAKAYGLEALALTDTDRVSGLLLFYQQCLEQGIKPILGVELSFPNPSPTPGPKRKLVMLARNRDGYADLCEITTSRQLDPTNFTIKNVFNKPFPNLYLITYYIDLLTELADTPNRENLFGELVNNSASSRRRSREVERICRELHLPLVASNDSFFLDKDGWYTHRVLAAIGANTTLSRQEAEDIAPPGAWFRSPEDMTRLFPNHGQALANTKMIADSCQADLDLGTWIMPEIRVPAGHSPETWLAHAAWNGLEGRYAGKPGYGRAREIQEKELAVINKLGYASYFLMVKQIRDWANEQYRGKFRRPTDCTLMRGSAANSITFFNIGASDLDPIKYDLYFERFLNEERSHPPDADLDFGWDERDAVFDYFNDTWGRDRVAVMCTTNRMRRRAAFRETAKVFGYSEEQISRLLEHPLPENDPARPRRAEHD